MPQIFVASDGTGNTAEQALKAALTQFEGKDVEVKIFGEIRTELQVHLLVREAKQNDAFIVHTLVSDRIREEMHRMARHHHVEAIDLMGPLLDRLSHQLSSSPAEEPGLFRKLNDSYFRRIETMQFAFNHDDGKRIEELEKAEIVLLGVSRTFKTPLSIYLAFKGWYIANVPIVLGINVPEIVFEVPADRVFCLVTMPNRLAVLRRARKERLGDMVNKYADLEYVRRELLYAQQIFHRQPRWQHINVTSKSIEEISSEIVALLPKATHGEI